MENSCLYTLRVLHHDPYRPQHIVAHDEGMYFNVLCVLDIILNIRIIDYLNYKNNGTITTLSQKRNKVNYIQSKLSTFVISSK